MLDAREIVNLQDEATTRWHEPAPSEPEGLGTWEKLLLDQHHANFDLWHHEDAARDTTATGDEIAHHKHAIDRLNQRRNDLVEQMDVRLLGLAPSHDDTVALHSETPGMMIDRLSILSLKRFHTEEELERPDATEAHRERNRARLAVLEEQADDLARCLDELWRDILEGRRRFKLYRQMKMYNDPELNPVLYRKTSA